MVKYTCMSSAMQCADEKPSDRRYLSKESVVFGEMERVLSGTDIEHGDRLDRCIDPSITLNGTTVHAGSSSGSGDQHFRSPCYVTNGKNGACIFQSSPLVGVVASVGKNGLAKEASANRHTHGIGSVRISSDTQLVPVQANGLFSYSVRQADVTPKLNEQSSSNHAGPIHKLYGEFPSTLGNYVLDRNYEDLSDCENKVPVCTLVANHSDTYANTVVQDFSLGYGSKNSAFRTYAETGQTSIWSTMPTTFPSLTPSKTIKENGCEEYSNTCNLLKENTINECNKAEHPRKLERDSYDCLRDSSSLNSKTKSCHNDICCASAKQKAETCEKSEEIYVLQANSKNEDVSNHVRNSYMAYAQNAVPVRPEVMSKVVSPSLLGNGPVKNETWGNAQSATRGADSKSSYVGSLTDNTVAFRKYGGNVAGSNHFMTQSQQKYNAPVQIKKRSASPSFPYCKDKYRPRSKYRYYRNDAPAVNKYRSPNISKSGPFVSNNRPFLLPKETYGNPSDMSATSDGIRATNSAGSSLNTDRNYLGERIKDTRPTAITSKLSSEGALRKSVVALTKKRTRRKLAVPQRSAAQKDPYFRGATVWLQTLYKDGRSRLQISAFYSNVKVAIPRIRRGYSRVHGGIPDPYSCSETEIDMSPLYGRVRSPCGIAKTCASCRTRRTPLWRDAEDGTPLCNACGIRYKKYRLRCSKCWNIPKKDIKTYPNCPVCGGSLRYSFQRKTW